MVLTGYVYWLNFLMGVAFALGYSKSFLTNEFKYILQLKKKLGKIMTQCFTSIRMANFS
jgi:hypothetical protein